MTPRVPAAPVTFPVANALVMVPLLRPASPPAVPLTPTLTAPLAHAWPAAQSWVRLAAAAPVIVPKFFPARPPTKLSAPPLTSPVAEEPVIVSWLLATRPPAVLPSPARTFPSATEDWMVPELLPTRPPACRFATLAPPTLPRANELEIMP